MMKLQLGKFVLSLLGLTMVTSAVASAGVTVTLTSPSNGATVSSPATISAKATSGYPITGWHVYVDDKSVWNAGTTSSISAKVYMSSGKHKVYVKAWDSSGAMDASSTIYVNVSGGTTSPSSGSTTSGGPQPPSYAKYIGNIEDANTWGHCSDCAADPSDSSPPIATWTFQKFQSTPSLSGSSTKMGIHGSQAYANVLHWTKFGNQSQYRNFIWEFYIYGNSDMNYAQNLEFDLWQSHNSRKYMFGTQCNYYKKIWQGWNEQYNHWVDLPIPCPKFATGKWTRIKWYFQRTTDGKTRYISVTVNGTTYNVNKYFPSKSTSWGESLGVQFQQDLNKYAQDYTIWVDKVKLWMW